MCLTETEHIRTWCSHWSWINEDQNQEIYTGAIEYPSDYFVGGNDDDDDEEDNEPLNLGDYIGIEELKIEEI